MKKAYEAPKAVKHSFEAKDIITASGMLVLGGNGSGVGTEDEVMKISWSEWK